MIDLAFVRAGRAVFTVGSPKGQHYTYRVVHKTSAKYGDSWFVYVLTGRDNEGDYTYVGVLNWREHVHLTRASKYRPDSQPVKVFNWAMRVIQNLTPLPVGYTIQHAGKCGRCGRTLTDPTSIATGIGPVCSRY